MLEKHVDIYETTSVLPYLQELHLGSAGGDENDDSTLDADRFDFNREDESFQINESDYKQFSAQLAQAGFPSSSGSIARLNELTINSIMSNASKASRTSKTSLKCESFNPFSCFFSLLISALPLFLEAWTKLFELKKTKSSKSNLNTSGSAAPVDNSSAGKLTSRLLSGLRISKPKRASTPN